MILFVILPQLKLQILLFVYLSKFFFSFINHFLLLYDYVIYNNNNNSHTDRRCESIVARILLYRLVKDRRYVQKLPRHVAVKELFRLS